MVRRRRFGDIFSEKPETTVRVPEPGMSEKEVKEVNEKPFLNKNEVKIFLFDLKKISVTGSRRKRITLGTERRFLAYFGE